MRSFETQIELDITVEYTYTKGRKGSRDKYGAPEEPDDEDQLEVTKVAVMTQSPGCKPVAVDITDLLNDKQMKAIEHEAWAEVVEAQL